MPPPAPRTCRRPPRARLRRALRAGVAMALACTAGGALAAKQPDFPAPRDARVQPMGKRVESNGLAMSVREFSTNDDLDEVRAFYARRWAPGRDDPGMVESDAAAPWIVLSRIDNGYLMTVQMQPTAIGGTRGYLAISKLPEPGKRPARLSPPPSLAGSTLIASNRSEDEGQTGEVYLLSNDSSAAGNAAFYRDLYSGWRADMDQVLDEGAAYAMSFSRGAQTVNLTIVDSGQGARVTINIISKSLL